MWGAIGVESPRKGGGGRAGGQLCSKPGFLLLRQPPHPATPRARCQSPDVSFFSCLGLFPAFPLNWGVGSPTRSPSSSDPPGLPPDGPALPQTPLGERLAQEAPGGPRFLESASLCPSLLRAGPGAVPVLSLPPLPATQQSSLRAFSVLPGDEAPRRRLPPSPRRSFSNKTCRHRGPEKFEKFETCSTATEGPRVRLNVGGRGTCSSGLDSIRKGRRGSAQEGWPWRWDRRPGTGTPGTHPPRLCFFMGQALQGPSRTWGAG